MINSSVFCVFIVLSLVIMGFYISWLGKYSYNHETIMTIMLVILGILYVCAIYLLATHHPYAVTCVMILTIIFSITFVAVSKFTQKDGSKGKTFLFLGITPLISSICFGIVASALTIAFIK